MCFKCNTIMSLYFLGTVYLNNWHTMRYVVLVELYNVQHGDGAVFEPRCKLGGA